MRLPVVFFACCALLALLCAEAAKARHLKWEVSNMFWSPDCEEKVLIGINGQFPGPTIRAKASDTIVVELKNGLHTEGVVNHWHGIRQMGTPWAEGTAAISQCTINPEETFTYRFVVHKSNHSHCLIVDVADGEEEPFKYEGELNLVPSDWYHDSIYSPLPTSLQKIEAHGAGRRRQAMADVCFPRNLPFIALAAPAALLIFWLQRNLQRPRLDQLAEGVPDQITAIPQDLDAPTVSSSTTPLQAESEGSGSSRVSDEEDVGDGDEASRAELAPTFSHTTMDRFCDVPGIITKMSNAFGGILLDIQSSDESTIHPANGVLIQSMEIFCGVTDRVQPIFGTEDYIIEPYSVMFDCWVSKLEEDAEWICQAEKARKYIFLLNNTYAAWQMLRCPGASFSNVELMSRLISIIQRYRKSYFDECWVTLTNTCRLGKFTSAFHTICKRQMAWKVKAELRYQLRQEIGDLILPSYELSLLAHQANQCPLSEILYCLKRLMAGEKKQKKLTVEELEKVINDLFEG